MKQGRTKNAERRTICNLQYAICNMQFAISFFFTQIILIIVLYSGIPLRAHEGGESAAAVEEYNDFQSRAGQGGADLSEQLKRELGAAAEKEDDNPLANIARGMMAVRQRMLQTDAGPATRALQKQIIDDLDRLIQQVRKSTGQSSSSASQQEQISQRGPGESPPGKSGKEGGQKTGNKSTTKTSPSAPTDSRARKPDMQEMQEMIKDLWGELPAQVRQQMLQTPIEEFVPKYENLIEDYYRKLSVEKKDRE